MSVQLSYVGPEDVGSVRRLGGGLRYSRPGLPLLLLTCVIYIFLYLYGQLGRRFSTGLVVPLEIKKNGGGGRQFCQHSRGALTFWRIHIRGSPFVTRQVLTLMALRPFLNSSVFLPPRRSVVLKQSKPAIHVILC